MGRTSDKQIARCKLAVENAKRILKPGDRIRCSRCGGVKTTYTFSHWDGSWAVSESGVDDLSANSIDMLNGQPIVFAEVQS